MSTKINATELSGMIGEQISVRKVNGRVVVKNRPPRKMGEPSERVAAIHRKFSRAAQYAGLQIADEESGTMYGKRTTSKLKSAFHVALADCLRAPLVEEIIVRDYRGAVGDVIRVNAFDDFMVVRIQMYIKDSNGALLEKGEATLDAMSGLWMYAATVANPAMKGATILAIAFDRPGNEGTREVTL